MCIKCVCVCFTTQVCLFYSSGVVWEMKPKNRWKPFSQKTINLLEKTYQSQLSGKTEGGWVRLDSNLEVRAQPIQMSRTNHIMFVQ